MAKNKGKIGVESYKGVRDFYPEDQFIQNYIFDVCRMTAESYGYSEYSASPLELSDIYKSKSGDELVNEQSYIFEDRGGREVMLRPEMTPTLARMVAAKHRELPFPLRWYSTPNVFRYEAPQRGRLREHFQFNIDIFGIDSIQADAEIIAVAHRVIINFGAEEKNFKILVNSRKLMSSLYERYKLSQKDSLKISRVIDRKAKVSANAFEKAIEEIVGDKAKEFISIIESPQNIIDTLGNDDPNVKNVFALVDTLDGLGIKNIEFTPTLMRGLDYYTDIVFEAFDTSPDNNRALFGGGRYDNITDVFGLDNMPSLGFGMGDVTIRDFLETHDLLPDYVSPVDLYICTVDQSELKGVHQIAEELREEGLNIEIDFGKKKVGDQIKLADKKSVAFVACVGSDEIESGKLKVKNLETGDEKELAIKDVAEFVLS